MCERANLLKHAPASISFQSFFQKPQGNGKYFLMMSVFPTLLTGNVKPQFVNNTDVVVGERWGVGTEVEIVAKARLLPWRRKSTQRTAKQTTTNPDLKGVCVRED